MKVTVTPKKEMSRIDRRLELEKQIGYKMGVWMTPEKFADLQHLIDMWIQNTGSLSVRYIVFDKDTESVEVDLQDFYTVCHRGGNNLFRVTGKLDPCGPYNHQILTVQVKTVELISFENAMRNTASQLCRFEAEVKEKGRKVSDWEITVDKDCITIDGEIRYFSYEYAESPSDTKWFSVSQYHS